MIEDHWETRQEYVKLGNELASLARKQEKEKKEREEALKKMKEQISSIDPSSSAISREEGIGAVSLPMKQVRKDESKDFSLKSESGQEFSKPSTLTKNLNEMSHLETPQNLGMNLGKQHAVRNPVAPPISHNQNPFMGQNRNF